jgi:hypothetical protein
MKPQIFVTRRLPDGAMAVLLRGERPPTRLKPEIYD